MKTVKNLDDILKNLNEKQKEAVTYEGGPLLILAGAGSGKTRALTTRMIYLLSQGVDPNEILGVTFTNKAASEMRHRVSRQTNCFLNIGTFHSICLQILRKHPIEAFLKEDFTIFDDQDQLAVIKECMKELSIDDKRLHPKRIREKISRSKDDLLSAKEIEEQIVDYEDQLFFPVYMKYEEKLRRYNGLDFGDLITRTVQLLQENPEILSDYQDKFRYVLVDEYQDTNFAQYVFINLIAKKYRNITVVGDPDQSIYEWRGANIENILNFEGDYSDAKVIRLEQNYRSTNNILKAANAVIANNLQRKSKDLWSENGEGSLLDLYRAFDEREEARFMVNQLFQFRSEGFHLKDMVTFYRVHSQSRVLEEELRRNNLPYKIIGGIKFYSRKEIKDLLAYFRVIQNPEDEVSLKRIINVPKRGIGDTTVEKISNFSIKEGFSFYEGIKNYITSGKCSPRNQKTLIRFIEMVEEFRIRKNELTLTDLAELVLHDTGYVTSLERENTLESRVRLENIREFYDSLFEFQGTLKEEEMPDSLRHYLEFISLQTSIDEMTENEDVFTLMTLHSAKGLEFPVVFMVGLEEELLPHVNSIDASNRELEEERRLCYVGMTRAKERLILSHALTRKLYGSPRASEPSRFLHEIPNFLINRLNKDHVAEEQDLGDYDDDIGERVIYY